MQGNYSHTMDAKGRLFFPAKFREKMGEVVYVCPSVNGSHCINAYSEEAWNELADRLKAIRTKKARKLEYELFSNSDECTFDANGRIIINQKLRERAKLDKMIKIIGLPGHVEIWNEEINTAERIPMEPIEIEELYEELEL